MTGTRNAFAIRLAAVGGFLLSALFLVTAASAQEGPIRIKVGFPAGGGTDMIARLVGEHIKTSLGMPVVVENRPGAGGFIAAEELKHAAPDGKTLMISPVTVTVFAPLTHSKLRFDPAKDFAPVSLAATYEFAIAVGADAPKTSLQEFFEWVRADPVRGAYGVPTLGGPPHFFGVMLASAARVELRPVPYKGGPPLIADLVGGQLPAGISSLADFLPQHRAGKIRVLAVSGMERSSIAPDIPTFREIGFAQIEGSGWFAFHTKAGTPRATIDRLSAAIAAALRMPNVREKLVTIGLEPVGSSPDELGRRTAEDAAHWAPIVKASGFRADD